MPVFAYSALASKTSVTKDGKLEASNIREAKALLRAQGYVPISLEEEKAEMRFKETLVNIPVLGQLLVPGVGMKDISVFTQQLYTLLDSGIALIEALYMLEQQSTNKRLQEVVRQVRSDIIAGDSFSSALSRFPNEFSKLYISMVRAGENSGELERIFQRLGILLEKYIALRNKVTGALVYPAFTVLIIIGVLAVIFIFVIPQFKSLFSSYGSALPLPTQILMTISQFVQQFWYALAFVGVAFGFWFNVFRKTNGKTLVDQWVLTLPLFGDVMRKVYVSRFTRTLGTIFGAGVSLTEAVSTSAATIDNEVLQDAFDRARESILIGGSLNRPLEQTGAFPLMVTKMIAIGEETGNLENMLNKAADFLDVEVDKAIATMTTLIEPIMIVVLGGIILGVALAMYIPMFEMGKLVAGGGH
jgi:type IV pilus assembly protein PilC